MQMVKVANDAGLTSYKAIYAAACYRGGRYEEAREVFNEVFKAGGSKYTRAIASLVQAMNYDALKQPELARASFHRGVRSFTSIKSSTPKGDFGRIWRGWIVCSLLEEEARQLLNLQPDQETKPK